MKEGEKVRSEEFMLSGEWNILQIRKSQWSELYISYNWSTLTT